MSTPRVIGLIGHPGSGKDSCAAALAPLGFRNVAFADALRAEVANAWRVDLRMLTDRATKEVPLPALAIGMCNDPRFLHWAVYFGHSLYDPRSPRWVLQRWGSDFRRNQDPDYWVRIVRRWAGRQIGIGLDHMVITDVRLPNEAALVRDLGGRLVRVHRPDLSPMAADTANHSSESHADLSADAVIHNDASLDALQGEVQRVLGGLFGALAPALEVPL
jgi:hypothetical protein